jgi:RHS repeat-associated protein
MKRLPILFALALLALPATVFAQASPSPFTSGTRYDAAGHVTGTISADPDSVGSGNPFIAVRNTYDAAGRLTKVETGTLSAWQSDTVAPASWPTGPTGFTISRITETTYDAMGRKTRETVREGAGTVRSLTQYSYDALGRLECTAVRMNESQFGGTLPGACTQAGGAVADRITRAVYDTAGQRLQLREGVGTGDEGAEATWVYSANGQVTTVIDGNGNRADLRYDGHGRQDRWTFPGTTRATSFNDATPATALASAGSVNAGDYEEYGYDPNGNRTSLRKRDGSMLGYTYDALNRATLKTVPERMSGSQALTTAQTRDVYYSYDLRNLQVSARFDSQTGEGVTNSYDGFGRLASTSTNMGGTTRTLTYAWDADGNRIRTTYPDNSFFTYNYDALNRLTLVRESGTIWLDGYSFTAQGAVSDQSYNAAWISSYGYDGLSRLNALTHNLAGTAQDVSFTLGRNPASQISSQIRSNDAYAWAGHYAVDRNYTTNGLNQYSAAGSASFSYDLNGNLVSDGSRAFFYDVENRLVSSSNGAALVYDPLGRLFQITGPAPGGGTTITRFLYDGDALVAEYDSAGTMTARYVHGSNADGDDPLAWDSGATRRYLISDQQGSVIALADASGTAPTLNTYDEYGIPGAGNQGRFQYTGQAWLPELGMYYYKARIYSPTLGRFMQTDPVGYADQFNLYGYVGNDPVNLTDPTGEIRLDRNGNPIFILDGPRQTFVHQSGRSSEVQGGYLLADNGRRIQAFRNTGSDRGFDDDCHGYTFAHGRYWINNDRVEGILHGDGYRVVGPSNARPGDVAVYREGRNVVHSGIVRSSDGEGNTRVESTAGVGAGTATRAGAPGPNGAWPSTNGATVTYYRQSMPSIPTGTRIQPSPEQEPEPDPRN